jgi:hypothetical protein
MINISDEVRVVKVFADRIAEDYGFESGQIKEGNGNVPARLSFPAARDGNFDNKRFIDDLAFIGVDAKMGSSARDGDRVFIPLDNLSVSGGIKEFLTAEDADVRLEIALKKLAEKHGLEEDADGRFLVLDKATGNGRKATGFCNDLIACGLEITEDGPFKYGPVLRQYMGEKIHGSFCSVFHYYCATVDREAIRQDYGLVAERERLAAKVYLQALKPPVYALELPPTPLRPADESVTRIFVPRGNSRA